MIGLTKCKVRLKNNTKTHYKYIRYINAWTHRENL